MCLWVVFGWFFFNDCAVCAGFFSFRLRCGDPFAVVAGIPEHFFFVSRREI